MIRRAGVMILCACAGLIAWSIVRPYQGFSDEVFVDIPKGSGTGQLSALLKDAGVVEYPWQLLLVRALRPQVRLQAGEYRFDHPASPWEIFSRIERGDVHYYELVVPEGSNRFDIAASLAALKFIPPEEFLKAAANPSLIHDLDPKAPSLEGYLFPSTYRLTRHTTGEQLCRQMTAQFTKTWKAFSTHADPHTVVTLASLIEKETGVPAERPLIAAVFRNRLERDILLQCDPTTVYAAILEGRYHGVIHRSDLDSKNPYNTYQHAGLPPGPIANPGQASLAAALAPADADYLFFVARPDHSGGHNFSTSLHQHEAAVSSYRHGQKKNQAR